MKEHMYIARLGAGGIISSEAGMGHRHWHYTIQDSTWDIREAEGEGTIP